MPATKCKPRKASKPRKTVGGSASSDAVVAAVPARAFCAMDGQATNRFPGMKGGAQNFASLFAKPSSRYTIHHQTLKGGATASAPIQTPAPGSTPAATTRSASGQVPAGVDAGASRLSNVVRYPASVASSSLSFNISGGGGKAAKKPAKKAAKKPAKKATKKKAVLPSVDKLKRIQRTIQSIFGARA